MDKLDVLSELWRALAACLDDWPLLNLTPRNAGYPNQVSRSHEDYHETTKSDSTIRCHYRNYRTPRTRCGFTDVENSIDNVLGCARTFAMVASSNADPPTHFALNNLLNTSPHIANYVKDVTVTFENGNAATSIAIPVLKI